MSELFSFSSSYNRLETIPITIGTITLGGNNPIRLQSMTNTPTLDTDATVNQSIKMIKAGSELVRITAPGVKDAENLRLIKRELVLRGYHNPLIADIHFQPKAAEIAAMYVEKVRINPGNYTDRAIPGKTDYTDAEYQAELERMRERLKPLVHICNDRGTVIRVGSNHGSLSQRIMSRYGNTPEGMVVSAMEFIKVFEDLGFHQLVLSMKASNPRIMVHSVRMLVEQMKLQGTVYPIHLGVTEAGAGMEGRIKSAAGIAALLEDGIGDTIRVSLTEPPEDELPPSIELVKKYYNIPSASTQDTVMLPVGAQDFRGRMDGGLDTILAIPTEELPADYQWHTLSTPQIPEAVIEKLKADKQGLILDLTQSPMLAPYRTIFATIAQLGKAVPVMLKKSFTTSDRDKIYIEAGRDFGFFLLDGLGDGVILEAPELDKNEISRIVLSVLQASRVRISRAEFIACPSCGRTRFNIQKALADVQAATRHLKNLTIGVMGCIVNGPGEMIDADFGYVGAGNGLVALYKGREQVEKNVPEKEAVAHLIQLIKDSGKWQEPVEAGL